MQPFVVALLVAGVIAGQTVPQAASALQVAGATTPASPPHAAVVSRGGIGIIFTATPAGGLIAAVAPGSPAERAGLKAGQTIRTINGTSVVGFDMAGLTRAMHVETPAITLGIVGVGQVRILRSIR